MAQAMALFSGEWQAKDMEQKSAGGGHERYERLVMTALSGYGEVGPQSVESDGVVTNFSYTAIRMNTDLF